MSQADLSRAIGSSRAAVSNVISGNREVGRRMAEKIANAFRLPVARVYQEAGILPSNTTKRDALTEEVVYLLDQIETPEGKKYALAMLRTFANLNKKKLTRGKETTEER